MATQRVALDESAGDSQVAKSAKASGAKAEVQPSPTSWRAPPVGGVDLAATANPRYSHALAYDPARMLSVLFGGIVGGAPQQDTWVWNGTDWQPSIGVPVFPARADHAMAAATAGPFMGTILLYGGDNAGVPLADTWRWMGSNWQQLPVGGPGARTRHAMAFFESQGVWVLFGGFAGGLDWQTWVFDMNTMTWTNVTGAVFPTPREKHAMVYDSVNDQIVLFGGYDGFSALPDTWVLRWVGGAWIWSQVMTATTPAARQGHAMSFDADRGVVVMFGGTDTAGNPLSPPETTWEYDGLTTDWSQVTPFDEPVARYDHAMTFDIDRHVSVMYGGQDAANTPLADTWEYPYLIDGQACGADVECYSGNCVDGVCCNSSCAGGTTDCQACSVAAGSSTDGVCEVIATGLNHVCRASITGDDTCDPPEVCNGTDDFCPAEAKAPEGTNCGPATGPCNDADTCDGAGICLDNLVPADTRICRPAIPGGCDVDDYCDGTNDDCPVDIIVAQGTPCGDPSDTTCTDPDTCSDSGVCLGNHAPNSTLCRADAGECDVAETCNDGVCPADGFEPAGTNCGAGPTSCSGQDTCDGNNVCLPNHFADGTECRADTGECDVAEVCAAGVCPADDFEPPGTACGSALDDACTDPDTCDGNNNCLANNEPDGTECRPDAGDCDVAETCSAGVCPADAFEPAGTACGDQTDETCNLPDTCDAAGACQDNFAPASTVCRPDAGECDVAENCDGAGNCPADTFEPEGTTCGDPTSTVCTNPDTCDAAGNCQDNHVADGTECRAEAGECDVAETCSGGVCPVDSFEPAGTTCGDPLDDACTNPDSCDGSGACLANNAPNGTSCRPATGPCDVSESCNNGACPADGYQPAGTACGDPLDDICTNPDTCDGSNNCLANHEPDGTLCRAAAGDCDVAETCSGGACPADTFEPVGTTCGSGPTLCSGQDTCGAGGVCLPNHLPPTTECRADTGECDVAELCDGAGNCPADGYEPAGVLCGDPTENVCDHQDTCDGANSCLANLEPVSTVCREAASQCDRAEYCDGAGGCPVDIVEVAGTPCGDPSDTSCTDPDQCDGAGNCLARNAPNGTNCGDGPAVCSNQDTCTAGLCVPNHQPAGSPCGDQGVACRVDDECDGSGTCLDRGFLADGTACGSGANSDCDHPDECLAGACDPNFGSLGDPCGDQGLECYNDDECNGGGSCVDMGPASAGTACGNPADTDCTDPDTCNGSGGCLANNEAPGTICNGMPSGPCDLQDTCNAGGACVDHVEVAGTVCRPPQDINCDPPEACDGTSKACPADVWTPDGTNCPGPSNPPCDLPNECRSGLCDPNYASVLTECRPAVGDCDVAESCNGNGGCPVNAFAPVGTVCDDTVDCTMEDECDGTGTCVGVPLDADGDTYVDDNCPGGTDCDDGNALVNPNIFEGPAGDDVCADGIDNNCNSLIDLQEGTCGACNVDADCDDANVCNGAETCDANSCVAGIALDCNDGNVCTDDTCDPVNGCEHTNNTAPCSDGDTCTTSDTCEDGVCVGGASLDCNDDNVCTDDSCDADTGCVNAPNAAACDDGDACTEDDTCSAGACVSGSELDCDDSNVCTNDSCSAATGCVYTNNSAACEDGDACTTGDTCEAGICVGGAGPDCDDLNPCTDDSCDANSGCVNTNNSAACDDGNACTTGDTCAGGACVGGPAPDCDDGNVCTTDSCDSVAGCVNTDNAEACDDGDACTIGDACAGGTCVSGTAIECDDSNDCTEDSCDAELGCVYVNTTDDCDDGDACTVGDACADGACISGDSLECDDENSCTDDTCDADSGCVFTNNTADCDDGDACTTGELCAEGVCGGGEAVDCDDGNPCTDDTCDAVEGCIHTDNATACDDGNPCTDDSCDPEGGCIHENNDITCDDGDECTTDDVCVSGTCVGTPGNCKTSGGGCGCSASGNSTAPVAGLFLLALLGLARCRRRD